jgi:hypothetical protein
MRIWMVPVVLCASLALTACESDEPLTASSGNSNNLQVQIVGAAVVPHWDVWDFTEDANGNGQLDNERDLDNDGNLDAGEDTTHNGVLDPGEDRNGDGRLTFNEDLFCENGIFDRAPTANCPVVEDANFNCQLDIGEDLNADNVLQTEDIDCDGRFDATNEDTNRNGVRDREDVNGNNSIDAGLWCEDTGIRQSGPVPVPIAGEVVIYRKGNPNPEVLASTGSGSGNAFNGLTPYDTRVLAELPDKNVPFGAATLHVTNGEKLPAASPRIMQAHTSFSPGAETCTTGFDFGAPNLGAPLPLNAQATAGDIVSVRLHVAAAFSQIEQADGYGVVARVLFNGAPLTPSADNSATPGQPITFSAAVP